MPIMFLKNQFIFSENKLVISMCVRPCFAALNGLPPEVIKIIFKVKGELHEISHCWSINRIILFADLQSWNIFSYTFSPGEHNLTPPPPQGEGGEKGFSPGKGIQEKMLIQRSKGKKRKGEKRKTNFKRRGTFNDITVFILHRIYFFILNN